MAAQKNNLISNLTALTVMQMFQYIAPLIVLPSLVRIISPASLGVISFAQAIAYYFALLPDLGANLYATREIALIKDDKEKLSAFVSGILLIKTGMGLLTQLSNVFYPYVSRMLKESLESGLTSIRTGFIAGMLLSIPNGDINCHISGNHCFYFRSRVSG